MFLWNDDPDKSPNIADWGDFETGKTGGNRGSELETMPLVL